MNGDWAGDPRWPVAEAPTGNGGAGPSCNGARARMLASWISLTDSLPNFIWHTNMPPGRACTRPVKSWNASKMNYVVSLASVIFI